MRVGIVVWCMLLALILVAPVGAATPLFAAGDAGAGHDEGKLNLFKGALDLTIWSLVVFLILFLLLSKFAWPQIREGLDRREQGIARDKHEADLARQEAAKLRGELDRKMAEANEEIRRMVEKARLDAQQTAAEEMARGKTELAAERERLMREVRISTDDGLHRIWGEGVQLAALISSRTIRKQLSIDDHRALVDEALAEFRAAAQSRREEIEGARA